MCDRATGERPSIPPDTIDQTFDLVVIGAGVSGSSPRDTATGYLTASARFLPIDQWDAQGGM